VEVKGVEAVAEECCFHRETMPRDVPGGRQWVLLRGGAWKAVDLPASFKRIRAKRIRARTPCGGFIPRGDDDMAFAAGD
jgi:hypothetical protein